MRDADRLFAPWVDGRQTTYSNMEYSWSRGINFGERFWDPALHGWNEGSWVSVGCDTLPSRFPSCGTAEQINAPNTRSGLAFSPRLERVEITDLSCESRGWGDPHMVTFDGFVSKIPTLD